MKAKYVGAALVALFALGGAWVAWELYQIRKVDRLGGPDFLYPER
jgi:hypothetical protein